MRARRDLPRLPLKPLYTVPELMAATGLTRKRMRNLLRKTGVELFAPGRAVYVPLSEIQRCLEPLWAQILFAQGVTDEHHE